MNITGFNSTFTPHDPFIACHYLPTRCEIFFPSSLLFSLMFASCVPVALLYLRSKNPDYKSIALGILIGWIASLIVATLEILSMQGRI